MVNMTLTLTTTHPFTNTTMTKLESNDTFTDSTIGPVIQFTPTITRPAPTGRSVNVTVSVLIGATTPSKTYKFVISGSTGSGLTDTTVLTVTVT